MVQNGTRCRRRHARPQEVGIGAVGVAQRSTVVHLMRYCKATSIHAMVKPKVLQVIDITQVHSRPYRIKGLGKAFKWLHHVA
jgi:hypothetical protein